MKNLFTEEFVQVNEIMGYVKHGDETIATNGSHYMVGTKKNDQGFWDHDSSAVFDHIDKAKAFVDGGKKGEHTTIAQSVKKVSESATPFIDNILSKNFTQTESSFKAVMAEKLSQALSARRVEIAQSLYSRVQGAK